MHSHRFARTRLDNGWEVSTVWLPDWGKPEQEGGHYETVSLHRDGRQEMNYMYLGTVTVPSGHDALAAYIQHQRAIEEMREKS